MVTDEDGPLLTADEFCRLYGNTKLELVRGKVVGLPRPEHVARPIGAAIHGTGREVIIRMRPAADDQPGLFGLVAEWLKAGVGAVVMLDPETRTASAYRADRPPDVFREADTLTLPDILPGFAVPVASLFA